MSSSDLTKLWTTSSNISKFIHSKSFFRVKNWSNLSKKMFHEEYLTRRPTFIKTCFRIFQFLRYFISFHCAQFLSAQFIIWVSLTMTRFSEKMLISTRYIQGISHWTGLYELALTDRNMQVKSCLKVVLESWDCKFLI